MALNAGLRRWDSDKGRFRAWITGQWRRTVGRDLGLPSRLPWSTNSHTRRVLDPHGRAYNPYGLTCERRPDGFEVKSWRTYRPCAPVLRMLPIKRVRLTGRE